MKMEAVLNVVKAYCNADAVADAFYQLNYCDVEKLDDERVKLVFNEKQLKYIYNEFKSLESFIKDTLSKMTEATEQYVDNLDPDELVEDINVEFSDNDIECIINDEHELFEIRFVVRFANDDAAVNDVYFVDEIMHALEEKLSEHYDVERIEKIDSADEILVRCVYLL